MVTSAGGTSYPIGVEEGRDVGLSTTADASNASGVSWGAILAGAAAAAALSLILLVLGAGLGLSAVSPWRMTGARAATVGVSAIVWLAFTQIAASALGGYMAGRMRVKWARVHSDEVYFRDTAHGLLSWAVATLATAALLTSAIAGVLGSAAQAGGEASSGVARSAMATAQSATANSSMGDGGGGAMAYAVDSLFRSDTATPDANDASQRTEIARIFANGLRGGSMAPDDRRYVGALIAKRTGLAPADAERRVDDVYGRVSKTISDAETAAKQAAEKARKAAQYAALWTFVALMSGAFFASLAAMMGGRRRDGIA